MGACHDMSALWDEDLTLLSASMVSWLGRGATIQLNEDLARARLDGKIAIFTLVSATELNLPDAEMRRELETSSNRLAKAKKAELLVVESSGLVAATVRSLAAGMALLRRPPYPTKVARSVADGSAWVAPLLAPHQGKATRGPEVEDVVRAVLDQPKG
jgi:hypothetical protein